jgi:hypothetical protein
MRKGEQTRQEIIRKAAPIFNQKGYEDAALSALMEATASKRAGFTVTSKASNSLRQKPSIMPGPWRWTHALKAQRGFRIRLID